MYLGPEELHCWVELALPLRSCLVVWFVTNQARTKALSDQMSFRNISKCCFYDSVSYCCHCFVFFCYCPFFFLMWHIIRSCQWMQNSQSGILKHYSEIISHGSMGLQIACQAPLRRVFLHLPTSDIYVSTVTCVDVSVKKKKDLLSMLLFSLTKNTWPQRASDSWRVTPLLYLHAAVGERISVYVSLFQSD